MHAISTLEDLRRRLCAMRESLDTLSGAFPNKIGSAVRSRAQGVGLAIVEIDSMIEALRRHDRGVEA